MNVRLTALSAFLIFGTFACDPSKPELDKTKAELTTVTAERDSLKSQLDQANSKVTAMTTQVADLQAKLNAAAAPPAAAVAEEKPAPHKAAGKAGAPKAKPLNTEQKKEMEAHPEARRGAGHFN
jgi:hypothetical protein